LTFIEKYILMNVMENLLRNNIDFCKNMDKIISINKGYSDDKKYLAINGESKYLIKIFSTKNYEFKMCEYNILKKMSENNVKCSEVVDIGLVKDKFGFMILTYIEGSDAGEELAKYSDEIQYNIGFEAGCELLKIHKYTAPDNILSWYERKRIKHQKYIEQYNRLNIRVKDDIQIMEYINKNIDIMKKRPNIFQHDDFHVGNMIISNGHLAGVIDFNRFDWGDPIHEFIKVGFFSSAVSIPFSIGQIKGYHNGKDPDELFWKLYSLYLAMCIFSSIVWQMKVEPKEMGNMMEYINNVLRDHDNFRLQKPKWYID
jgi:aminoglycoside phosphotransferase (APT) family kinase protein